MRKNRLIAGFMGITPKLIGPDRYAVNIDSYEFHGKMDYMLDLIDAILYDKSLDKLFEVVDKIESLGYRTELYSGSMILFRIGKPSERRYFLEYSCNTKIETIYNACVGFIEWYNKQQK